MGEAVTVAIRTANCLSCGDVPWPENGKCPRCGSRILGVLQPDGIDDRGPRAALPPDQPKQAQARPIVMEPSGTVWRWLRCTQELKRDIAAIEQRSLRAAEHFQNQANEARRARLFLDKVLDSVAFRDPVNQPGVEPWHGKGYRMPIGRWAALHDECLGCGRTDRRHVGHGYCGTCYQAAKKAGAC